MPVPPRTYAALFLLSFAALMSEVTLTRIFSFSMWYHFAYMTISVALLGYAAAGSVYYAFPDITRSGVERALCRSALAAAALFVVALLIIARTPFNPAALFPNGILELRAEPRQFFYLSVLCLAVVAPFFATGLCITILLRNAPRRIAELYGADLAGAALGCVGAVVLLSPLGAPGVVILGSLCLAAAALLFGWPERSLRRQAAICLTLLLMASIPVSALIDVKPAANKFLAGILKSSDVRTLFTRWNPVYRVDVVGGRNAPLRLGARTVWGVSQAFAGMSPEALVITHDGGASTMMYRTGADASGLEILDYSILKVPYVLLDEPEVFVIGVGGGVDILTALKNRAQHITGVELNAVTLGLLKKDFSGFSGNLFNGPNVTLVADEGRNFIAHSGGTHDLIQLTGIDTLAAIYSGAYVLSESYLYTVEAMHEYLTHLTPRGLLSIVRGDGYQGQPPYQVLRLLAVAIEALRQLGVSDPSRHIAVIECPGRPPISAFLPEEMPVFDLLVRRSAFSAEDIAKLRRHAEELGFEAWHLPGERFETAGSRLITMSPADREQFLADYPLDLRATTDDRPFFFNFLKWKRLIEWKGLRADYTFASGQLVLLAVLVQSVLFALVLIVAPLLWVRGAGVRSRWRYLFYFACLGVGFMFIEISYVQRFTLFLGSPIFGLAVVLATLLVSSGTGSLLSSRLARLADTPSALRLLLAILCVINVAYVALLPAIVRAALGMPLAGRILVTMLLLAPPGLVMGTFFPLGMRVLDAEAPETIPWAWAANGVASVVGSVLSIVLAMIVGFRAVNVLALAVYLSGVLVMLGTLRGSPASARRSA